MVDKALPRRARRGCRQITLNTHGYELWAVLEGYPSPHRHCYLKKSLA